MRCWFGLRLSLRDLFLTPWRVVADQRCTPSYTVDVAEAFVTVFENGLRPRASAAEGSTRGSARRRARQSAAALAR